MKVDISALLRRHLQPASRSRCQGQVAFFERSRDDDRALQERQRCPEKLKTAAGGFDIPPEVMSSLPSMDQIQAKAAQARRALPRHYRHNQPAAFGCFLPSEAINKGDA